MRLLLKETIELHPQENYKTVAFADTRVPRKRKRLAGLYIYRLDELQYLVEKFDASRRRFWLDEVVCISKDEDLWARKSQLLEYGYISKSGKLSDDLEPSNLQLIDSTEFFEIGNLNKVLNVFEKKWIPLPYFSFNKISNDKFGPTDWVRLYFERINETEIKCVLLVFSNFS